MTFNGYYWFVTDEKLVRLINVEQKPKSEPIRIMQLESTNQVAPNKMSYYSERKIFDNMPATSSLVQNVSLPSKYSGYVEI